MGSATPKKIENKPQPMLQANLLLPLRIFMGATFLYAGVQHLTDSTYFDSSKPGYIGHLIAQYAVGSPLHDFLLGVVQPDAVAFGYVVAVGEILVGIAVLIGFLFKIAAVVGLLLNITFFLSATWNAFPFYFGSDIVFAICWLTLLLAGPQQGLSIDSKIAARVSSMRWLSPAVAQPIAINQPSSESESLESAPEVPLPERAKLYPRQVIEVNRAFERIRQQFVSHEETQAILEFVRAFVISLGADRGDTRKILAGLQNLMGRDTWEQAQSGS